MSKKIILKRAKGINADFSEWNIFGDFEDALKKMLGKNLDMVFSEDGATARLSIDTYDSPVQDLQIECEIQINEDEVYASAKVSLQELLTDVAYFLDEEKRQRMAAALRALADSVINAGIR